jgi:O-antigen ligase
MSAAPSIPHRSTPPPANRAVGVIAALCAYTLALGGTWFGIMERPSVMLSLTLLVIVVGAWVAGRRTLGWRWHRTTLDSMLVFWLIAFALSTLANLESGARVAVGLWFSGLYILIWYVLHDTLANGLVTRGQLVTGFLLAAAVPMIAGVVDWLIGAERLSGLQGNPNILGALLVMIVPLSVWKSGSAHGRWRLAASGYLAAALIVTLLTLSRGAWLGLLVAGGVWLCLRWPRMGGPLAAVGIPLSIVLLLIRGDTGRLDLYEHALMLFGAAPLTGNGLFTFRLLDTTGTGVMHLHAHNAILHIGAEMGIPGLIALGMTVIAVARPLLRVAGAEARWATAALAGVAVHQMVDFPILSPTVALSAVLVLSAALPTGEETSATGRTPALVMLAAILCAIGIASGGVSDGLL